MADKPGDIFTDKLGTSYELRPDPKDGHLRPVTLGKGAGGVSILTDVVTTVVATIVVAAMWEIGRAFWEGFKEEWKNQKS